jgi:hypothetical protein
MGEGLNGEGNRREIRLYQPDEKQPRTTTTTRHLSWSVNRFFYFIHTFIHSLGGVLDRSLSVV